MSVSRLRISSIEHSPRVSLLLESGLLFLIIYWGILVVYLHRTAEDMKGEREREREGMTCSKGTQVGVEPTAAAARSKPLYMGARSTK